MYKALIRRERDSGLEVLRIFSMLLVILLHYLQQRVVLSPEMAVSDPGEVWLNKGLTGFAIVCVNCFILISGFYGIKWRLRSFWGLVFQILFWCLAGYLIGRFVIESVMPQGQDFSVGEFLSTMWHWYRGRWFISAYLVLFLLSPALNSFVEHSSSKALMWYVLVFYLFSTVYGYLMLSDEFGKGTSAISLVGLYMLGAWLRKADFVWTRWSKWIDLSIYLGIVLLLTVGSFILLRLGVEKSLMGYINPVVLVQSVFFFQFFRKLNLGHISWVNYLAGGAFAAYLLHMHPLIAGYCNVMWRRINGAFEHEMFFIFVSIVLVYLVAAVLDRVRVWLWGLLSQRLE